MINLTLPFPPSLNMMYPTSRSGRRYTSKRGVDFKAEVKKLMDLIQPPKFECELHVEIRLYRPKRLGDIDNYAKAVLDSLKGLCFNDDKQIVELHLYRFDDKKNPRVEVTVKAI